jgi:hypothetical protein
VGKQNLATDPADALIIRATQGSFEVVRTGQRCCRESGP